MMKYLQNIMILLQMLQIWLLVKLNLLTIVRNKIKIIASMGTGNKFYPEMLEISDIHKTSVCSAKVMRKELKERGIKKLPVIYSKEVLLSQIKET